MSEPENPFGSKPSDNPFGSPPSDNPFGSPPSDSPFGAAPPGGSPAPPPNEAWRAPVASSDPFAAPPPTGPAGHAPGAIPALVLGILGIVFCAVLSPFAWYYGLRAERLIDASGGALSGRGAATAGKVLGIVWTILMILLIIVGIGFLALGIGLLGSSELVESSGGSGSGGSIQTVDER